MAPIKWSMAMTSYLIELIKANELLYNPNLKGYNNREKRTRAQALIGNAVSNKFKILVTTKDIQKKWSALRTCFLEELKKVETSRMSGPGGEVFEPSVYWWERMQFLVPCVDNLQYSVEVADDSSANRWDTTPEPKRVKTNSDCTDDDYSLQYPAGADLKLGPFFEHPYDVFGRYVANELKLLAQVDRATAERTKRSLNRLLLDSGDHLDDLSYQSQPQD